MRVYELSARGKDLDIQEEDAKYVFYVKILVVFDREILNGLFEANFEDFFVLKLEGWVCKDKLEEFREIDCGKY